MRAIIIGAGRGRRLMPTTENAPKCFAEIRGKRILDWTVEALAGGGATEFCFIGGYRMESVQREYPHFTFRRNDDWENNNILVSPMCAEDLMDRPFVTTYSDILFTRDVVRKLVDSPADIALGIDTDWREHYRPRTQHPPHDAEKVITANGVVQRVQRTIPYEQATGEFIGVAKFSARGGALLREHYQRRRREFWGKPYREAASFEKAYLIHLFQDMIEQGVRFGHADTHGRYREIDTQEDMDLAQRGVAGMMFPASVVGSLPRPPEVLKVLDEPYSPAMDEAIRGAIAMQEKAGLDVITDGEWRRRSYIGVIAELAHGFALETNPLDGRPWTVITERVSLKDGGFIAREAAFLKKHAKVKTKVTLPAPALLGERLWHPVRSRNAYPKRDDFVRDCVAPLRREIELIAAMGVDIVQIDDPHLCLFVDPEVRAAYKDPDAAADFAVEMINALVAGFRGVKFAVHLCRRAGARVRGEKHHAGTYGPILPQLNRLKVQHLTMEFTAAGADDLESLGRLREDFELGLGVVDVTPGVEQTAQVIAGRVRRALQRVEAKRITLNPDCGFAPGSAAKVGIDEVERKLRAQVEAARLLRASV